MTIKELEPKALWSNFYSLTRCPRPSKHEEAVRNFLVKWAKDKKIECRVDKVGNVIMTKPATKGMENRRPVVLQAHMDMVPQARAGKVHDFLKDPIETKIVEDWVYACDTTLGADDGMGVAAIMAVFESKTIKHGPLEALITTDEETGMTGAFGLKAGELKGEFLLNLDSETEGELYVGCAGGVDATMSIPYATEKAPKDYCAYRLTLGGLKGGHSGMEINTGRANVNKLMFRHLRWVAECGLRLVSINGGNMRNAIPRDAEAVIAFPKEHTECILAEFDKVAGWVKKELSSVEPDFFMKYEKVRMPQNVICDADTQKIINLMMVAPNGVIRMSRDMEGLVETSLNLAIVKTTGKNFTVQALLRSSVDTAKEALAERLVCLAELAGGTCKLSGAYPGWKPNMQSPLLKTMKQVYKKLYKKEPAVVAIHAGLECGLLGGKYPDMDMISFGPTLQSPHSPDERANIPSCKKFYDYLVAALEAIPEKK
ncbi:MAG: aminoacyl-histidine dipeptidase [Bacteroidales bacterium]|jgi:dipeptidase D|nr:aminoacyl-histidine dipeptidase [Bacteroidales bacterium]